MLNKVGEHMTRRLVWTICLASAIAGAQQTAPPKTHLKVGDIAPDFTVPGRSNTTGMDIKLSDFQGKKTVVLAFFPAAFTGG